MASPRRSNCRLVSRTMTCNVTSVSRARFGTYSDVQRKHAGVTERVRRLPTVPRPKMSVCILGDQFHCDAAKAAGLDSMSVDDLKKLNKDKKLIKTLGRLSLCFQKRSAILMLSECSQEVRCFPRLGNLDQADSSSLGSWSLQGRQIPHAHHARG